MAKGGATVTSQPVAVEGAPARAGALQPGAQGEVVTLDFLSSVGIPTIHRQVSVGASEAVAAAEAMGYPVVVKSAQPLLIHKSDSGGVFTDVRTRVELETACQELERRQLGDSFLVARYIRGVECLVGFTANADLGRSVVLGLGGTLVEVMGSPIVEILPVTRERLKARVEDSLLGRLLAGYRGARPASLDDLLDLVMAAAHVFLEMEGLVELEMNPVIVGPDFAIPVDARMQVVEASSRRLWARTGSRRDLSTMISPRGVAVIGASNDLSKPGGRVLANLVELEFPGRLFAVNPTRPTIQGLEAYASVADLPVGEVDLACVAVPPAKVASVIESCEKHGIPHALILTGGADGSLQQQILDGDSQIRVVGPNSLGLISPNGGLYASFAGMLSVRPHVPVPGGKGAAFISQSGAIASALGSRLVEEDVDLSFWMSTGNELDVEISEVLAHLSGDADTRVILLYIEGLRDGNAFMEAALRCRENGKRVIAYKAGTSASGQRAIVSHTGAIAGDDRVYDAIFERSAVTRVASLQALLDAGRLVRLPRPDGDRIGVVTMSGGVAAILADECHRKRLSLSTLSADTLNVLSAIVPDYGNASNPVDLSADAAASPDFVLRAVRAMLSDGEVDTAICQFTTNADPAASEMAEGLVDLSREWNKPLLIGRLGAAELAPRAVEIYRAAGIPIFDTPERLVDAAWILSAGATVRHHDLTT